MMPKKSFLWLQKNNHFLLILAGSITWSLVMVRNGLISEHGMGFWGANAHDGLWHIALSNGIFRGSFEMPVFPGEVIKNYHIGYDLLLTILAKLTFIPIENLYFQVMPPILVFLTGYFVYKFVEIWKKSGTIAFWSMLFVYFGGSFGWIISLVRDQSLSGESMFWSMQSISTLINPPFALSLVFIFAGMYYLVLAEESKVKKYYAVSTLLFGLLAMIKVYASILILAGLFFAAFYKSITSFKQVLFKVFAGVLILNILIIFSQKNDYQGTFILQPFWFLETMMSAPDRLHLPRYASAMINYKLGGNLLYAIIAYFIAFLIFIIGNLGTRIIGFAGILSRKKAVNEKTNNTYVELLLVTTIFLGILIPTFFVQRGTLWNTIQFFYYSQMFLGIYAGIVVGRVFERNSKAKDSYGKVIYHVKKCAFSLFVIFLTVVTTAGTLQFYLSKTPTAVISREELDALQFLRGKSAGTVLTQPFVHNEEYVNGFQPLYSYESTAYVSALANKEVYIEDRVNLEITGYEWEKRTEEASIFFVNRDSEFIDKNNIKYLYILKSKDSFNYENAGLINIFENNQTTIYENN